ncbi:acetate--CoA ligase [Pseudobacteriovorax antillogorgiicola]|uniref:Acetyl-coenzyme A synthetase n=1 Tax=Pseudobacteriovorax antillogorgiicola TaxID=1513793 RepID=A0A1Y6C995_9BACT|nr:acetate--CoA ligase [Pseudobacteriovorax antillogorgiicola]TCS49051.1 acetyl-coenzyme A synthetase [Pseudobacteriovorax antillogorgiicola]SMF52522.1 acetyl-coenzyme A synthetase [Pseudobacteriovorax antillogorgiicola]
MNDHHIKTVLSESREFPPPEAFQSRAHIQSMEAYETLWKASCDDPERFWGEQAKNLLHWQEDFTQVLDWKAPYARWFDGGKLNVSENCLDRHLDKLGDKPAIIWEGEPGDKATYTYRELHQAVCRCANALSDMGIQAGDTVSLYMPMIPELAIAVLACARIGAIHSVVFAGFSAEALAERNRDASAKLVITADALWRRGNELALKDTVDEALRIYDKVDKVLVVRRTGRSINWDSGRDHWWHDTVEKANADHKAQGFPSEQALFILYTSGSTGKPKGILHTSAGYLLGTTLSSRYIFDLKDDDVYWCTADVGWITGHSYVVYGPLSNGATIFMYEGAPDFPHQGRFWELIERYKISIFYTAPTAIRAFMKWGEDAIEPFDLSSLRLLGTVGEPINPEAWMWFRETIGKDKCPIVDTWWQTETGSIMISPLPGATPTVPGTATKPFFGIQPDIVDQDGQSLADNQGGYLVIRKPWPSMLRTIHGDSERYEKTYWSHFKSLYFTGDGARRDEKGNFWIMGRIDDVLNVAGHRLSTMEIESALVSHPHVAEAAVVGKADDVKGQAIACFVTLHDHELGDPALNQSLKDHVVQHIGALARPETIIFTKALPKTRSGKIMRRLLRDVAAGEEAQGDMTTLEDSSILEDLKESSA